MRIVVALGVMLIWAFPGLAVQNKTHQSTRKHSTATHRKATAKEPQSRAASSGKRTKANRARSARGKSRGKKLAKARPLNKIQRQTWRTGQMQPTPDRYREIQQALVTKGYTGQEPDGVWSPEWVVALKRFQQDQKLEPNGKLNSLSIITLGLGPRRETVSLPASASAVADPT